MRAFNKLLSESLKGNLPEEQIKLLPSGYQKIGDIVIINLKKELWGHKKVIGDVILKSVKNTKTVCMRTGPVSGEYREPKIERIAGDRTVTVHRENRCLYKIDVSMLMFSKGNVRERGRVAKVVKKGETVVDMFAGIGFFSIPIAKTGKPSMLYAVEINPVAVEFLRENIKLNEVRDKVTVVFGDCRKVKLGDIADRIVMGYLPNTHIYLPYAFRSLKPEGGTIHYHDTFLKDELWEKPIELLEKYAFRGGYLLKEITYKKIVKSYAPNVYHIVIDGVFERISKSF
jgi:tRNA wybutosine-synthesizing protein 2